MDTEDSVKPSAFGSGKRDAFWEQRMGNKPRPKGNPITGHALDEGACGTSEGLGYDRGPINVPVII